MIGTNHIHLNYATMLAAVQEYMDKRFVNPPIVKSMLSPSYFNNSSADHGTMIVEIQEPVEFLKGSK